MKKIFLPLDYNQVKKLKAGDEVLLSGELYTARDQAHKRLVDLLKKGRPLPVDLRGAVLYYCGPTAARPGRIIGSCGPTTSSRMDAFTPALLEAGAAAMIGKGCRSPEVIQAIRKYGAVYFIAAGGAGAYLSTKVKKATVAGFTDLGPEAVYRLEVKDFPVMVGVDAKGRSIY